VEALFWISLFALLYPYALYPAAAGSLEPAGTAPAART